MSGWHARSEQLRLRTIASPGKQPDFWAEMPAAAPTPAVDKAPTANTRMRGAILSLRPVLLAPWSSETGPLRPGATWSRVQVSLAPKVALAGAQLTRYSTPLTLRDAKMLLVLMLGLTTTPSLLLACQEWQGNKGVVAVLTSGGKSTVLCLQTLQGLPSCPGLGGRVLVPSPCSR